MNLDCIFYNVQVTMVAAGVGQLALQLAWGALLFRQAKLRAALCTGFAVLGASLAIFAAYFAVRKITQVWISQTVERHGSTCLLSTFDVQD